MFLLLLLCILFGFFIFFWFFAPLLPFSDIKAKELTREGRIFLAGQSEDETKWAEAKEKILILEGR